VISVGVLYGGRSGEHEVSRCSGASVFSSLDRTKYSVAAIGIDYDGKWYYQKNPAIEKDPAFGNVLVLKKEGTWSVSHSPHNKKFILTNADNGESFSFDIIIPAIHGTFCEDGTLQGLLDCAGVAYVGAGVLGSSVSMDKDVTKRILRDAGVPVVPWITVTRAEWTKSSAEIILKAEKEFGYPYFVKPANAGSSVGVHKIKSRSDADAKIADALQYDIKVIIEQGIDAREIECAVLGNDDPKASVLGEVIPNHEFYSYEAKYIDADGARLEIPAGIDGKLSDEIRACAVKGYKALCLSGMARVDFFLDKKTKLFYLNEPNTLPGFTSISMYPKLWEATNLNYPELLDELIRLAFERAEERSSIKTVFTIEGKS
jgi:D-alanine-D-alanine ligase